MIRLGKLDDLPEITQLLSEFADQYLNEYSVIGNKSLPVYGDKMQERINLLANYWIKDGYMSVAVDKVGKIQGLIGANVNENIWIPGFNVLTAVAWYVRPEYRNSTLSTRLFKQWHKDVDRLVKQGVISLAHVSLPSNNSASLPRGWQILETNWVKG